MRKIIFSCLIVLSFQCFSSEKQQTLTTFTVPIGNGKTDQTTVTSNDLYNIFTLLFRYWDDGTRINVILLDDTLTAHKEFLWEFLGISPTRYKELIETRLSSGRGNKPVVVSNEEEMLKTISSTNGGIGYIGNGYFVYLGKKDDIKIIKVINN